MKMTGRKALVFWVTEILIVIFAILTMLIVPASWENILYIVIMGLLINGAGYISFTVLKDFIISKYYRSELDDKKETGK